MFRGHGDLLYSTTHNSSKPTSIVLLSSSSSSPDHHLFFFTLTFDSNNFATVKMLNTIPNTVTLFCMSTTNYWMNKIAGSCNGLVLLVREPKRWLFHDQRGTETCTKMLVVNVTTLESVELSNNPLEFDPYQNLDGLDSIV
ncbi:hypothetical protein ACH5RR_033477 [Cinchona calisaya]|uniref:Uncharacterized protein n=1 Tax=Cinchona calisaya TaxID=153742 RepID=A0ABD2YPM9_9GENT